MPHDCAVRSLSRAVVLMMIPVLLSGCGDVDPFEESVSTVGGRVQASENPAAQVDPSGVAVSLARVESDGSLTIVSNATVETNAEGEFRVRTDLSEVRNLIVVAVRDDVELRGVVSAEVRHGAIVFCPPLSDESTVEATIFARLVARGSADLVSMADIGFLITADVAARVKGDAVALEAITDALEAEGLARATLLADVAIGASAAEIESIEARRREARADLDRALYLAREGATSIQVAVDVYLGAEADAFADAGVSRGDMARVKEVSAKALVKAALTLPPEARIALSRAAAEVRARAIGGAVLAHWITANAPAAERQAVVTANGNLLAAVRAANSELQIVTAFAAHHDAVLSSLVTVLPDHAEAIETVAADILGAGGSRVTLTVATDAPLSIAELVGAYVSFFSDVDTSVRAALGKAAPARLAFVTEAMILTTMTA